MSTAYEELVERCRIAYDDVLWGVFEGDPEARSMQTAATKALLAEVFRTLETAALNEHGETWPDDLIGWVRDCPLAPPKAP